MKELFLEFCQMLADPEENFFIKMCYFLGFSLYGILILMILYLTVCLVVMTKGLALIPFGILYLIYKLMVAIGKLNG